MNTKRTIVASLRNAKRRPEREAVVAKTTKAVGRQRLLKLAAYLRTIPSKRFDYREWAGDDWKGKTDLSCGTTACALGWATTMPLFKRLGLKLSVDRGSWCSSPIVVLRRRPKDATSHTTPFLAAASVFDISLEEAEFLFAPHDDDPLRSPKFVAKKIERFVREAKTSAR